MNIWNGKGSPAVGQVCEAKNHRHGRTDLKWCRCEIVFSSEHYVILKSDEFIGQNEVVCVPKDLDFRPVKTKEQIAAEEADKAAEEMFKKFGGPYGLTKLQCIWVISEGYRKFEIVEENV